MTLKMDLARAKQLEKKEERKIKKKKKKEEEKTNAKIDNQSSRDIEDGRTKQGLSNWRRQMRTRFWVLDWVLDLALALAHGSCPYGDPDFEEYDFSPVWLRPEEAASL